MCGLRVCSDVFSKTLLRCWGVALHSAAMDYMLVCVTRRGVIFVSALYHSLEHFVENDVREASGCALLFWYTNRNNFACPCAWPNLTGKKFELAGSLALVPSHVLA